MVNSKYNPEFSIRKSQLLTPYGTGALIDINNQSIMLADSAFWKEDESNIIHDVRLQKKLDANGFVRPPTVNQKEEVSGIRFPKWFYAPKDRSLKTYSEWHKVFERSTNNDLFRFRKEPYDARQKSKDKLVPVRLICACTNGHAQDFPWNEWVHDSSSKKYKSHKLKLRSTGASSSISDLNVVCDDCDKSRSLTNIFDVKAFNKRLDQINVSCNGDFIWKKEDGNRRKCSAPLNVLLKNSNSFYFPNIISSVNIPFKENKIYELVIQSRFYPSLLKDIEHIKSEIVDYNYFKDDVHIQRDIETIRDDLNDYTYEEILETVYKNEIEAFDKYEDMTEMEFRREEYNVLSGKEDYDKENSRLNLNNISQEEFKNEIYGDLINGITLINKLEVVRILESYSRIKPSDTDLYDEETIEGAESKKVSLKRKDNRYIGVDLLGEGIFVTFDKNSIANWLNKIKNKRISEKIYDKINNSYNNKMTEYIYPEFYLLHTLSHILIKELSETSGYSSSALAERLYFSNEKDKEMYGILIYTSSSDSEGTLGGLVKQGYPKSLMRTLSAAVEKSKWCSFDPVCISRESQGRDSLNGSACHACALVSETSCELSNLYLDRSMLIGDLDNPEYGIFNSD